MTRTGWPWAALAPPSLPRFGWPGHPKAREGFPGFPRGKNLGRVHPRLGGQGHRGAWQAPLRPGPPPSSVTLLRSQNCAKVLGKTIKGLRAYTIPRPTPRIRQWADLPPKEGPRMPRCGGHPGWCKPTGHPHRKSTKWEGQTTIKTLEWENPRGSQVRVEATWLPPAASVSIQAPRAWSRSRERCLDGTGTAGVERVSTGTVPTTGRKKKTTGVRAE